MSASFDYVQRRLEPQKEWHDNRAKINKWCYFTVEVTIVLAGAAIPVVNLWAAKDTYIAGVLSAFLGGVVVVITAIGKLFKFHDNWLHYRALVEALGREKELYTAIAGDYAKLDEEERDRTLVERVEYLIADKTAQFLAANKQAGASGENPS